MKFVRPGLVSRSLCYKVVAIHASGLDNSRSLPAEMGICAGSDFVKDPSSREHAIPLSATSDIGLRAKVPANGSSLVTEYPLESPLVQVVPQED